MPNVLDKRRAEHLRLGCFELEAVLDQLLAVRAMIWTLAPGNGALMRQKAEYSLALINMPKYSCQAACLCAAALLPYIYAEATICQLTACATRNSNASSMAGLWKMAKAYSECE